MKTMPPRLVYIVAANRWSGVERYSLDLCRHFSEAGWPVFLLTRDARAVDSQFRMPGVRLRHAPLGDFTDVASLFALCRLMNGARREGGRKMVVHVSRYHDAFRALLARKIMKREKDVRVVMTCHFVKPARKTRLYRWIYRHLDSHIFVSEAARQGFLSSWGADEPLPFDPSRLTVIHNSLNLPVVTSVPERGNGPVTALYHGRLAPGKGLETLLEAFAITVANKVKLRLRILGTGDPDYVDALRHRAEQLGIMERIDWTRHTPDPLPYIREAHFGVLPSDREEGFGLANVEYMYEGRPQICSGNGAQREYLTDGQEALLVTPGDAAMLAEAMQRLAADPEMRVRMGERAKETFGQRLSWSQFAARMEKVYFCGR